MTLRLLIVGEGPRDEACVPRLVERILQSPVESQFENWARLHRRGSQRGLGRKLAYSMRQVKDRGLQGLVATVDSDQRGPSGKLKELKETRADEKALGKAVPAALGEAIPHLEAWLLDDERAVREALGLASDTEIPAPTKVREPKAELDLLIAGCNPACEPVEGLARICAAIALARCIHADATGFADFCADVRAELGAIGSN